MTRARILVTGGAGYIGSHTCKYLHAAGYEPVTLDDLRTGHTEFVRWGPFVQANIADAERVRAAIAQYQITTMVHFAASAYVGESMEQPQAYFANNVAATLALLEVALQAGIRQVVFSSSCATYGIPQTLPIPEDHPQQPVNPYGDSKLFIEKVLRWYDQAYGLRSVLLRYFNAAGADPDGEIGEWHEPETHILPRLLMAVQGRLPTVSIFGSDYPTPDGTAVRDYIHVSDLARAHVRALAYLLDGGASAHCNLGTGKGHSIRELVAMVEHITGRPCPTTPAPRRPGDPPILIASPGKAATLLGWRPEYSELATIVETAWRWQCKG